MPKSPAFYNACITWNYPWDDGLEFVERFCQGAKFGVYGMEKGEETHREHFQIYVEFDKNTAKTMAGIKRALGAGAHIEERRGTPKQAAGYCMKGEFHADEPDFDYAVFYDQPHSTWLGKKYGQINEQGARNDLNAVAEAMRNGQLTVDEIIDTQPTLYHQYGRTLEKIQARVNLNRRRDFMTECFWYWGETGVGKTRRVYEEVGDQDLFVLNTEDKGWWDGYAGQPNVLIDDFRGEIRFSTLLKLCDRYPYSVPRRNLPPVPFLSRRIYVTSCSPPDRVYYNIDANDTIAQLTRRITVVKVTRAD